MRLYLAYGCNLNLAVIGGRCPDAQAVCAVTINGFKLAFAGESSQRWGAGGVATLLAVEGSTTPGALYRLTAVDEAELDRYEGLGQGHYFKDENLAGSISGFTLNAEDIVFTYIQTDPQPLNPPPVKYINAIRQGYLDWNLPGHPLDCPR